jgi:metal-responsive CopG/Arc/MetJ family transcriptional regulator
MKGRSKDIQAMADRIRALKGVALGKLVLTHSGKELKSRVHTHAH